MRLRRNGRGSLRRGGARGGRPGLEIHIEELVLHGFAPGDRHGIAGAVQRELTVLFEAPTAARLVARASTDRLDGGSFSVPRGALPAILGAQIARAVHRGLGG